jgi:hypothetical protein
MFYRSGEELNLIIYMKKLLSNRIKIILISLTVIYLFIGCSTRPDYSGNNYPGVLASEGKILFYFNLEKDDILISQFMSSYSGEDLSEIIDRTDRLSISINGFGINSEFTILAEGKYPKFFTNLALSNDENWEKQKGTYTLWENKIDGLYASIPLNSVVLIANRDIETGLEYIDSGKRNYIPDIVKAEYEQSAITVYSHMPGAEIYNSFNIPLGKMLIQDLFFVVRKAVGGYSISGELDFVNNFDAKVFSLALKLGLLMKLQETGKSSVMKIVHDSKIDVVDNKIIIDNIILDSNEMTDLMSGAKK